MERNPSAVSAFLDQYRSWPRVWKWTAWAGLLLIGYFLILEPSLEALSRMNVTSDRYADGIRNSNQGYEQAVDTIRVGRERWGGVRPGEGEQAVGELRGRLSSIFSKHRLQPRIGAATSGEVKPVDGAPGGVRYRKASFDVEFSAAPDVVSAVLADIEGEELVARVAQVRITRVRGRPELQVSLTPEVWYEERRQ